MSSARTTRTIHTILMPPGPDDRADRIGGGWYFASVVAVPQR